MHLCLSVHSMSLVSTVESVRSPGMISSVTAPLTSLDDCVRDVYGVSKTLALKEASVSTYGMVMSVSNLLPLPSFKIKVI